MIAVLLALVVQDSAPTLDYTVTVPHDRAAYLVELHITNPPNPSRLVIPNWAPGAYVLMNSGDNIRAFAAVTSAGDSLPVRQDSPISWVVETKGQSPVTIRYTTGLEDSVAWRRPNNRWFLRTTSGIVDGPRTFMYLDGWKQLPARVSFAVPTGWRVATGLAPATADSTVYVAPNYDVLIDSPMLLGHFLSYSFTAAGTPHRAVVDLGGGQAHAPAVFVDMLRRISTTATGIFGGAPYQDYTFIFVGGRGGGLEHLNSTTIGVRTEVLARSPRGAQGVSAHELFHAWNVKRMRPVELGPFDYERAVRTVNLWWSEGVTDYYTDVILARAGLSSPAGFARSMAASIASFEGNPARLLISPERSSWTKWDPPAVNNGHTISYYLQGELLGFLLDLAIRDSTDNEKSLDDVMRFLLERHAGDRGFTRDQLVAAVRSATGRDFEGFWNLYVSAANEISWNDFTQAAGWEVIITEVPAVDARIAALSPAIEGGRWRAIAPPGGAAAGAGLRTGDELVRINGRRIIDGNDVSAAVRPIGRGQLVVVDVMRDDQPLTIRFRAGTYMRVRAELRDLLAQTPKMRRIRAGLLR